MPAGANATVVAHLDATATRADALRQRHLRDRARQGAPDGASRRAAPAVDVRADGDVLFSGLTNPNEEAADVPAGDYSADVALAGENDTVIGPADLDLAEGTSTIVYAWGSAEDGNLDLAVQTIDGLHSAPGVPGGETGAAAQGGVPTWAWGLGLASAFGLLLAGRRLAAVPVARLSEPEPMTRLSRTVWWAVLGAAATGLLLSLVVAVRAPDGGARRPRGPWSAAAASTPPGLPGPGDPRPRSGETGRPVDGRRAFAVPLPVTAAHHRSGSASRGVGLDAPVTPVGVADGRQMRLPDDPRCWAGTASDRPPAPAPGRSVLAGHVDSRAYGVGPLARLSGVRAGDVVEVGSDRAGARRTASTASSASTARRCPRPSSPAPARSGCGS